MDQQHIDSGCHSAAVDDCTSLLRTEDPTPNSLISLAPIDRISNPAFLFRHALRNQPCLLSARFTARWPVRQLWVDQRTGEPDLHYLRQQFGHDQVPVLVGDDECPRMLSFRCFIDHHLPSTSNPEESQPVAYLKDWHFQSTHPDQQHIYAVPAFLRPDWVNHEWWTEGLAGDRNPFGGDYRFVYFGTKDSWSPFHSDVLNSFSWSANVCGRKLWYMLKPGAEERVRRKMGQSNDLRPYLDQFRPGELFRFEQGPGEIVFVPSGWWHQVHNLEPTISINHNVVNAFNLHHLVAMVEQRSGEVRNEIAHLRDQFSAEEFEAQCQLILLADCRMNRAKLVQLLELIIQSRQKGDQCPPPADHDNGTFAASAEYLARMESELGQKCACPPPRAENAPFCASCAEFIRTFELNTALEAKKHFL